MHIAKCWIALFWHAIANRQERTARSLANMAGAKAKKIEQSTLALNKAKWKAAIGATGLEGRKAMPNGLTYRWAKGLGGWTQSVAANSSFQDSGQPEECPHFRDSEHHLADIIEGRTDIPLSDQAVVDKEAQDWATLWQELEDYAPPQFDPDPHLLHPMLENDIRWLCRSHPTLDRELTPLRPEPSTGCPAKPFRRSLRSSSPSRLLAIGAKLSTWC